MGILKKYIRAHILPFFAAIFCVGCEAVCDLLGPTLMAGILDYGIKNNSLDGVFYWGGLMLLVTAIGAVFAVSRNIIAGSVSQRVGADLRFDVFSKIMSFSEASADGLESGSLITRMTNDTTQVTQFINGIMRIFIKAPITCIGSIVLASMLNLRLSIIIYITTIVMGLVIFFSMKLSYPRFSKLQKAIDKVNSTVQEFLMGIRLVKAFGTQDTETDRFEKANSGLMKSFISSQIIITFATPLITFIVGIGSALAILWGGSLFESGLTTPGEISAFTIYMTQILGSTLMITNIFNNFVRTSTSAKRIKEIMDSPGDFENTGVQNGINGKIEFKNVTFSYPGSSGAAAIKDLSISIEPGERVAVIGPTGSGKSTLCWLLLRFYDPVKGEILLDGVNIKNMNTQYLRSCIALAPQKPLLFSGTVGENIGWGNLNASGEEIQLAARTAAADFTEKMDGGFNAVLEAGAVNISGGQKQRLSIARAIIKKSPITIMDDSTGALDSITERRVRTAVEAELFGTVITITQRCTTAMSADKIIVMENGSLVGFGNHRSLMENCTVYRDIYRSQVDGKAEEGM